MNFKDELQQKTNQAEEIVKKYLPQETGYQKNVIEAMNYSVLAGGKRLRPLLMKETFELFGGQGEVIEPFMAAIEMIHTYSLVHDDLPAMDNDEYRRGRKTTHVVYGEGMAVLAGDGLLNYAFETALKAFDVAKDGTGETNVHQISKALQVFAKKAGIYGMIGGQTADIEAENNPQNVSEELLLFIHEHKTAALIQSAMLVGAILAGATTEQIEKIEKCGYNIGIAFQIQDDILDVIGSTEILGKTVGSDAKNDKQTYVSINGLEKSKQDVKKLSEEAEELLSSLHMSDEFLRHLIDTLIYREK